MQLIKIISLCICLQLASLLVFCQNDSLYKVIVTVKDDSLKHPLAGVSIFIQPSQTGGITDSSGEITVFMKSGNYTIKLSSIGYNIVDQPLTVKRNLDKTYFLKSNMVLFNTVNVYGQRNDKNVESTNIGVTEINIEKNKTLPLLMGELDPVKLIQLSSGVQTTGDGNTGLYVRGGSPGQNLILYDGAPIYNPSHLLGIFSVFNGDAIEQVRLTKSGIPACYGGRSSAVMEIDCKNGDLEKYKISGGIGFLTSRLLIQGPIIKNKVSFIVSARRTYFEAIQPLAKKILKNPSGFFTNTNCYFYDINIKLKFILSPKDVIKFSSYNGSDFYDYSSLVNQGTGMNWGNTLYSLRWSHIISDSVYYSNIFYSTDYNFKFNAFDKEFDFNIKSGVKDLGYRFDFNYKKIPKHALNYGFEYVLHNFSPVKIKGKILDVNLQFAELSDLRSHEMALYFNDEMKINERLKFNMGIRYSMFIHTGPSSIYNKDVIGQVTDTTFYKASEIIAKFHSPEPRLSARYLLNKTSSLKASLTSHTQYTHYASLPSVSMPFDVWMPSNTGLSPEFCMQGSFGYFRNLRKNSIESGVEIYYRKYSNLIEFTKGLFNSAFQQTYYEDIVKGIGNSYGIEFSVKKSEGHLTGWVVYTLSHSTRQFDEINNGKIFVATYDRKHDASMVLNYELKQWVFAATFIYATGNAITLPEKLYLIEETIISEYGDRNSFRLPPYHRLDLSLTYNFAKRKRIESALSFSVYNVYNRANPFYIYFETTGNIKKYELHNSARQVSLFPMLPSITWNFKFSFT